jgi:aspartyl-tRNA(Asn)/glutamyl-tRNA(Gln) amidotransferase subunit C
MQITDETIDRLAHLARLEFREEEKGKIREDLQKIIGFCEKLNELDTEDAEPLIFMSGDLNVFREDEVRNVISHEEALRNAPKKDSDFFRVPKVISK